MCSALHLRFEEATRPVYTDEGELRACERNRKKREREGGPAREKMVEDGQNLPNGLWKGRNIDGSYEQQFQFPDRVQFRYWRVVG
ncbi:Hypothetical protein NTJ_06685 [Nesidiocoris tenuis]|nr:Hypothetical protein NTJ_06685 [Nesidiocoris tenuis]